MEVDLLFLAALIFAAAALYASVGHAGASGYLAAMALFGLAPMEMRFTALTLNIFVGSIAAVKYSQAGRISLPLLWPLVVTSIPCAYIGGLISLPAIYYKPLMAAILIYSAFYFFYRAGKTEASIKKPSKPVIFLVGACLGFLSGLVGVGGGIFLSPLLLFLRWETVKRISGTVIIFILLNSIAGLLGTLSSNKLQLPSGLPIFIMAAVSGGYIGAEFGSRRLNSPAIKRLLALVLVIAGIKMMLTL